MKKSAGRVSLRLADKDIVTEHYYAGKYTMFFCFVNSFVNLKNNDAIRLVRNKSKILASYIQIDDERQADSHSN
jgi:hypothetical protein